MQRFFTRGGIRAVLRIALSLVVIPAQAVDIKTISLTMVCEGIVIVPRADLKEPFRVGVSIDGGMMHADHSLIGDIPFVQDGITGDLYGVWVDEGQYNTRRREFRLERISGNLSTTSYSNRSIDEDDVPIHIDGQDFYMGTITETVCKKVDALF